MPKRPGKVIGKTTIEVRQERAAARPAGEVMVQPPPGARPAISPAGVPGVGIVAIQIDRRNRVAETEFTFLPFSAVTLLQVKYRGADSPYQGTGFLVEPGLVLTAAHVVHNPDFGLAEQMVITPGCFADKISVPPNPRFAQVVDGTRLRTHESWGQPNFAAAFDYAAILLPDSTRYRSCGRLRLQAVAELAPTTVDPLAGGRFMVPGFPIDKDLGRRLWIGRGGLMALERGFLRHLIDTEKGQSGSPLAEIITDPATGRQVIAAIGVHSRGAQDGTNNVAARVDQQFLLRVAAWKKELERLNGGR